MTGRAVNHGIRMLMAIAVLLAMAVVISWLDIASYSPLQGNRSRRDLATLEFKNNGDVAHSSCPSLSEADPFYRVFENRLDADAEVEVEDELILLSPPTAVPFGELHSPCLAVCAEVVRISVPLAARPLRC
jgi:hypothetical protein